MTSPYLPSVALALPLLTAQEDDAALIERMLAQLSQVEWSNSVKAAYYEGEQRVRQLGISIPPALRNVETVVGWAGTAVDVLEERLDWQGWVSTGRDDFGLSDVYDLNNLEVDSGLGHLDALIYGLSFIAVGSGLDGEPDPLVTVESARNTTGLWDNRSRRLGAALSVDRRDNGEVIAVTLYRLDRTAKYEKSREGWRVAEDPDNHGLGRVPVTPLVNRPRASRMMGRSEITRAVRAYTDMAVRTLLGMEVNREFYSAPQRYILGAEEDAFTKADGTTLTGWEAVMGRVLTLSRDEDGELPTVGQFTPAPPTPYLDGVRGLSQLLAAEAAIPAAYLGFVSDNPSSADAIRAGEARLVKRAERRQTGFGRGWMDVAENVLLVRDGVIPDGFRSLIGSKWRDASTPTRAAAADEAVKLIAAGVLPADSTVTYDRIGLTPQEQKQLASDKRRQSGSAALQALSDAAAAAIAPADASVVADGNPTV